MILSTVTLITKIIIIGALAICSGPAAVFGFFSPLLVDQMVGGPDVTRNGKESGSMPLLLCLLAIKSRNK